MALNYIEWSKFSLFTQFWKGMLCDFLKKKRKEVRKRIQDSIVIICLFLRFDFEKRTQDKTVQRLFVVLRKFSK